MDSDLAKLGEVTFMTPEELSRIREIYERAVANDSDKDALLDRECTGDEGLRKEIERLLKARDKVPGWLDQPALGVTRPTDALQPSNMAGRCLSGYTLIREIGRGGMGSVYLAERSDGSFRRQVAIKLVLPPANTAGVLARFQQEREILASLDHPNIAKLFDGGVTEEGWPYFVMELVDGQPIHRWCDERRLNISARIELFRGVLAAVWYAHQRLVVHRDLNPGNILVTNDGTVKLLDFGIAKVLSTKDRGT
ncbi:MAG: serine/threonine-protein kinase [Bryobacteraceae bacterium]